ncbi:tetratricopeptide repeat protein [Microcoleus vaginatus]|uniref:tetratricopeptide repeat protein n=1 Tax=Microcoleus vaginatus TaxID=119532 RepID=UPI001689AD56|nr:tetratricopeptide repeat protein [Microcoleus sp. FACHB-84]MBD2009626.1 tetratricopeptide repeat protein [Microcoleus sp. FACHB-45]
MNLDDAATYLESGDLFKQEGKLQEAIEAYRKAIELIHQNLEEALIQKGKRDEGLTHHSRAAEINPNLAELHRKVGEVLVQQGRLDEAIVSFQKAVEIDPSDAGSHHKLGKILAQLGQSEGAIAAYRRSIDIDPNCYEFYQDLGQTFYRLGVELTPENLYSYQRLWEILPQQANTNDSLTELYDLNDQLFLSATSHISDEDFVEELYRTYLKRTADVGGKNSFLNYLGDGTLGRQQCPAKIRQSSEFISLLVDSTASICFQEASAAYRRAVELNPDSDESYRCLGEALASQGKLDEAIIAYRHARELNPNFHELHNSLGETFYRLAMALNLESFWSYSNLEEVLCFKSQKNDYLTELYQFSDEVFLQKTSALNDEQFVGEVYRTYLKREADKEGKNSFLNYMSNGTFTRYQSINKIRQSSEFVSLYIVPIISFFLEEAIDAYRRAIDLNGKFNNIYFHNLEKALERQAELDIKPDSLEIYHLISRQFYISGKYDSAVRLLTRAAELQKQIAKTYQFDKLGIGILTQEWTGAIGHLGLLDYYVKMKILGWLPPHQTILLAAPYQSANPCYLTYWYRYFPVVIPPAQLQLLSPLTKYLEDRISVIALANGETLPLYEAVMKVQKQWEAEKRPHLHTLSDSDEERGWSCLQQLGVPKDAWFVGLHVRDTGYVNGQWHGATRSGRNAHIESYLLAIQSIVERGGWVIRMGDRKMKPLPPMPQVIDYAHSDAKSDWMDVFLWAKCRFFIGTPSGPSVVPPTFGVPCVLTNWASIQFRQHFSQDIFIPKLYWSENEQRYLTFTEMLSPAYIVTENVDYFDSIGVKVVDNTPEEINDLVWEMLERLEGKINYTEEDALLQSRFAQLVDPDDIYSGSRMGRNFLQKYDHLMNLPPDNFELYLQLGNTLVSQNQWEEALINYRRAVELNPDSFECHHQLGKTFHSLASELNPESVQLYNWLVELLAQPGQSNDFSTEPLHLSDSAFLLATSHLNQEDFLEYLYRTYLKRAADPGGKNSFLNYLGDGTLSREKCPGKVRQSSEFISLLVKSIISACLSTAIAAYRRAVELNPNSYEYCHNLGEALAQLGQLEEAIAVYRRAVELNPNSYESCHNLGEILAQLGQLDESIIIYRRAVELNPCSYESYHKLGEVLGRNQQLDEAWLAYRRAVELNPNFHGFFSSLGESLAQQGKLAEGIAAYKQAIQAQTNTGMAHLTTEDYHTLGILLAEQGLLDAALACFQQAPQIQPSEGKIYENIWKGLNQQAPLDETNPHYPQEIDPEAACEYFRQTSQYREITLGHLTEEDKIFLETVGVSLANLELMKQDNLALEEIYINSFEPSEPVKLSRKVGEKATAAMYEPYKNHAGNKSMIETGYIYSICPISGKILRSNQSFPSVDWMPRFFYRFVGNEIFYLVVNQWFSGKICIYLPRLETLIRFHTVQEFIDVDSINSFKSYLVSCWKKVKSYLSTDTPKQRVAALGFYPNLGHYLWNDVTGIQYLYDNDILNKVDKFLLGSHSYLKIGDIFPEIPKEKLLPVINTFTLLQIILEKNYFAARITDFCVKEQLAKRIYDASLKKCCPAFLQEVGNSQQHFPLLCFQIRSHCRVWLSQVEGIANIVKSLYPDFPNLGVVFEGWSYSEVEHTDYAYNAEQMIESEKAIAEQIIALLPPDINTYSAIGRMTYETIVWDRAMDMFIAPGGSGVTFISWIANKPGVVHGNSRACYGEMRELWVTTRENFVEPVFMSLDYIIDEISSHPPNNRNYDCDWKAIYTEVLKIVKGLNRDRS